MADPGPAPTPKAAPANNKPVPPKRRPRVVRRSLASLLVSIAFLFALAGAAIGWLIGTTAGLNTMLDLVTRFTPVKIEAVGTIGALTREFGFARITVQIDNTRVEAGEFQALLRGWALRPLRFDFEHLAADKLLVEVRRKERKEPPTPTQNIGVPLELTAERLKVGELTLALLGKKPWSLLEIDTRAAVGPWGYRVERGKIGYGAHRATVPRAELGSARPFALTGEAAVRGRVQDKSMQVGVQVKGSLVDFTIDGQVSGAGSSGTVSARITSFDAPEIKSLNIDVAGVDPQLWAAAAPQADLAVKAQLAPNETMTEISGAVQVVNRAPGTIDAKRIPARAARAHIVANARELKVERVTAELVQGSAQGEFAMQYASGLAWQTRATLADVDPAAIHSKLRPLRVDGTVSARRTAETTFVLADLANRGRPSAVLKLDAQITPREATINTARIALGTGFVRASGTVGLVDEQRVALSGELQRFEPGLLLKDVDARLSGSFSADGRLAPQPAGGIRFELADSRAWGRPLIASGRVDLDAAQRLDMDIDIGVRSARLQAKGGLGAADRSLEVALDVPALAELLPADAKAPLAGSLRLNAKATGAWSAPAVSASLLADQLRYAEHSLKGVQVEARYGGGADGELRVQAGLAEYTMAGRREATLTAVTLAASGRPSSHGIRLQGTTEKRQGAMLYAQGGWRDNAWRGELREFSVGAPFDVRLLIASTLMIGSKTEFGPAQIGVRHFRLDDVRFSAEGNRLASSGSFSGLQPLLLVPPVEGALTPVLAPSDKRTPLTLRGEWTVRAGEQIDGSLRVERTAGDLYAGRGPESALKLIDVRAEAKVTANELNALLRIESEKSGGLGASMQASLEKSAEAGWRLAQKQPWLIIGAFDIPTMDWVNALLSDQVRANVRLGGKLASTVRIEGTPDTPTATGRLTGDSLRVAWVEQGMRLENGQLRARLEDDLIVLDELRFAGPPRVRPADKRAAAAIKSEEDGWINASGRLRLRDFNGLIQVAATRLPLLQRSDRWIIASGGANIETSAKHVQLNGAVAAAAGFVDFSESELPTLASDVIVVRAREDVETRERRVTFGFDLGIDLGPAFYLRGRGLDTRVEGAVRLRSAGRGVVNAVGTIATVDGVYEGFGQKLKIARGRLNFHGAPENPGLDVLALRPGLPVEVGVSITRTAADPLVRLHSDPPMADVEALSWLVVGRPADQSKGDNLALAQAAAGLLGGSGEGYATRVTRSLGIDDFSIRSGQIGAASLLPSRSVAGSLRSDETSTTPVAGEIITIGKRLGDALSVSYEQAISGTSRIVQLNYQLSSRLSLVARGGTDNAVDLVYTFAFD